MADSLVSDGKAVVVTLIAGQAVDKGDACYAEGFHGIAQKDADGDTTDNVVALETTQREFELVVGGGVVAAKGDILYITTDGTDVVDATNTNRDFCKVTVAKDANNVVWVKLLENKE